MIYPNPMKDKTTLKLELPKKTKASIIIYDMNGTLVNDYGKTKFDAGTCEMELALKNATQGTYLIYIVSNEFKKTLRVAKID